MAQTLVSPQATRLQAFVKNPDASLVADSFGGILPNTQKNHTIKASNTAQRPVRTAKWNASLSKIQIASCADTLEIHKGIRAIYAKRSGEGLETRRQHFNLQVHYAIQKPYSSSLLVDGNETSPSPLDLDLDLDK